MVLLSLSIYLLGLLKLHPALLISTHEMSRRKRAQRKKRKLEAGTANPFGFILSTSTFTPFSSLLSLVRFLQKIRRSSMPSFLHSGLRSLLS